MSTFVLVHGAWGGAHGWRLVRPLLQQTGHAVFTPSLTGQGERTHLAALERGGGALAVGGLPDAPVRELRPTRAPLLRALP